MRRLSSVVKTPYTPPEHPDWNPASKSKAELTAAAGLNRASWDFQYDTGAWPSEARFDTGTPRPGPMAIPGDYTVRLTVGEEKLTQALRVVPDPRSSASPSDLAAQLTFGLQLRQEMAQIATMVETIRGRRVQIEDRNQRLAENPDTTELVAAGNELIAGLTAIEEAIHNPHAKVDYDVLGGRHGGAKIYSRLGWLFNTSRDHDGPPTQGMQEVAADLAVELTKQKVALDTLLSEDLKRLNDRAVELEMPYVLKP